MSSWTKWSVQRDSSVLNRDSRVYAKQEISEMNTISYASKKRIQLVHLQQPMALVMRLASVVAHSECIWHIILVNSFSRMYAEPIAAPVRHTAQLFRLQVSSVIMMIVKIIYTAFVVWLICLFFAFLGTLWESRKNKIPQLKFFHSESICRNCTKFSIFSLRKPILKTELYEI